MPMSKPEWLSGLQHCSHYTNGHGFEPWPEPPPMLADMSAGMWVSRYCTRGESEDQTGDKACKKGICPGFETLGRCHQEVQNRAISSPIKRT